MAALWVFVASLSVFLTDASVIKRDRFQLNLVHFNDFHARFEETSPTSTKCISNVQCIGGFPRLYTMINELKMKYPDSIVLNAGDSFQGTIWYNLLRWNVTQYFMNMLPLDAHTLGNHEFDHQIAGVVPYLQTINAPMLVSNIDDSKVPEIQNLYSKSKIIERQGRKIGIIGVIAQNTPQLANSGALIFKDEVKSVKIEADKLASQGVDIIIVLSHSGLEIDREIAKSAGNNIDIIVGGHSHSLLYSGIPPTGERPIDTYPIKVTQSTGDTVLIVQASAYTKYLGNITLYFDNQGKVLDWEGNAIYLANSIKQDQNILKLMEPLKKEVDKLGQRKIGETKVLLSKAQCSKSECNLGNFIADVFVDRLVEEAEEGEWTHAAACLMNQGGLRIDIDQGPITYSDLVTSQPFENELYSFDIKGKYILEALEFSVNLKNYDVKTFSSFKLLQISGIRVVFDVKNPEGKRVVEALIRCNKCKIPTYSPIEGEKIYRLATSSFMANGGEGYTMISNNKENVKVWAKDIDILEAYINKHSPITHGTDQRIIIRQ